MKPEKYQDANAGLDPELTPISRAAIVSACRSNPLSYFSFAAKTLMKEDAPAAVGLIDSAIEAAPAPKWSYFYIKAQALVQAEDFDRAAACAEYANRLQPRHHEIYILRLAIEGARRNFKEGIRLGREGLLYFANSLPMKTALLKLHYESKDYLQAAQIAVMLLEISGRDEENLFEMLAECLSNHSRQTGQVLGDEKWIAQMRRGIDKYPDNFQLNYFFALFCFAHGNCEEGSDYARRAARILPSNLHARLSAGLILYAAGKSAEAVEHFRELDRRGFYDELFFKTYYSCLKDLEMTEELNDLHAKIGENDRNLLMRIIS